MLLTVAQDGNADFSTIQAAVDSIPDSLASSVCIQVASGEYHGRVVVHKDNVHIIGQDRDLTVLSHNACAKDKDEDGKEKGTFLSFSVLVTGKNVTLENLTIRNDAGDGRSVGQAVALYAAGEAGVYRNCKLIACQDTLFCGPVMPKVEREIAPRIGHAECVESVGDCPLTHSSQYFEHCFIQGDVDFIFGPYRCWFEACTLYMNARGGFYTAANTPEAQPYGMVFHRCLMTGECATGQAFLGRPWRKYARTLFLYCDMDACVAPKGFCDWDESRPVTDRCGEYGTSGIRASQEMRHPHQKRLTEREAAQITREKVLSAD